MTMPALPLARRPSSGGSCPSECPSRGARSPVLDSNYVSDLGGAKRARTADLLHAMGNADVQYRQMLARDDPCDSTLHGPRPERRSDHGQKDLETMRDHMITCRPLHGPRNGRNAAVITASNKQGERLCIDTHTDR